MAFHLIANVFMYKSFLLLLLLLSIQTSTAETQKYFNVILNRVAGTYNDTQCNEYAARILIEVNVERCVEEATGIGTYVNIARMQRFNQAIIDEDEEKSKSLLRGRTEQHHLCEAGQYYTPDDGCCLSKGFDGLCTGQPCLDGTCGMEEEDAVTNRRLRSAPTLTAEAQLDRIQRGIDEHAIASTCKEHFRTHVMAAFEMRWPDDGKHCIGTAFSREDPTLQFSVSVGVWWN